MRTGDGTVTGSELQSAFGADNKDAADYVMSKLDTNGDGSISQSEFASGTTKGAGHHHHHMHAGPPPDASQGDPSTQGTQDPLSALLSSSASGASSQTESNSDGSSTTTHHLCGWLEDQHDQCGVLVGHGERRHLEQR